MPALFKEKLMTRALTVALCLATVPALAFEGVIESKMTMNRGKADGAPPGTPTSFSGTGTGRLGATGAPVAADALPVIASVLPVRSASSTARCDASAGRARGSGGATSGWTAVRPTNGGIGGSTISSPGAIPRP